MEFDTLGNNLIVADAYYGIWTVDLSTGKKTQLISPTEELDGKVKQIRILICRMAVHHDEFYGLFRRFVDQPKFSTRLLFRNPATFTGRTRRPISYSKTAFSLCSQIHRAVYSNTIARRNKRKLSSMRSFSLTALPSVLMKTSFWSLSWLLPVCFATT